MITDLGKIDPQPVEQLHQELLMAGFMYDSVNGHANAHARLSIATQETGASRWAAKKPKFDQ